MRIADAQIALEGFPEQAYDFSDPGIRSFVTENSDPQQLDAAATMLNSAPQKLIGQVFRATSAIVQKLMKLAQSTVVAKVKEIAGGFVGAAMDKIEAVLRGLLAWASKL